MTTGNGSNTPDVDVPDVDVVVGGTGFAGLYLLHRLRGLGFSTRAFESADDVGGTWYWNRYPGARCDIPTTDYTYSFDPALESEWTWSEKYATQPEILRYAQYVADKYDLRRDIQFATRIESATWDDDASLWHVRTDRGDEVSCRHLVMASGCLSMPKARRHRGCRAVRRRGVLHPTWPHEGVDFTGKRVARHRHRLVGHPVDPAHRRSRPPSSPCSNGRPTSRSRRTTARCGPRSGHRWKPTVTATASRRSGRGAAFRSRSTSSAPCNCRTRTASRDSSRRGRPASCSRSSGCSTTS